MSPEVVTCFDLDGPILDVSGKYYQVYCDLVLKCGGGPIPKADYWDYKRRRVSDETILQLSGIKGWSEEYRRLSKARIETLEYIRFDRTWPGVEQMLRDLRSRSLLVLVTLRHSPQSLHRELRALELLPLFDHILSAPGDSAADHRAEVKVGLVRKALGLRSLSGWFVGDTETDLHAGQKLGLRTAATTFGIRAKSFLAAIAPDVILEHPEDLIAWARSVL